MSINLTDELVTGVSVGNVGQLTENEEDSDVSCVFLNLQDRGEEDSLFFTRSDLFKLLAHLEEYHER